MKTKHSEDAHFICDICGVQRKRREHLQAHIRTHNTLEMFKCDTCSYITNLRQNMDRHVQDTHEKVKHLCSRCGKKYPLHNWKRHNESCRHRIILGDDTFECQGQEHEQQQEQMTIKVRPKRNCTHTTGVSILLSIFACSK